MADRVRAGRSLKGAQPYVISAIATIMTMGAMAGSGIGAFLILPWVARNYAYLARPSALTLIDGGYAVVGCTIMGAVLLLI